MSKYTPGPWSIDGDILLTHADPFEATPFGRVNISHAFTEDEREANRALILAAPDLLEALESITTNANPSLFSDGQLNQALTAIARAKGESQ